MPSCMLEECRCGITGCHLALGVFGSELASQQDCLGFRQAVELDLAVLHTQSIVDCKVVATCGCRLLDLINNAVELPLFGCALCCSIRLLSSLLTLDTFQTCHFFGEIAHLLLRVCLEGVVLFQRLLLLILCFGNILQDVRVNDLECVDNARGCSGGAHVSPLPRLWWGGWSLACNVLHWLLALLQEFQFQVVVAVELFQNFLCLCHEVGSCQIVSFACFEILVFGIAVRCGLVKLSLRLHLSLVRGVNLCLQIRNGLRQRRDLV
mmetsp:Transcript_136133/g.236608  ORF Transcript_136133/g.236608 Transcript_136133/m.236608 type:complete len:265 (-) Transcript_136133:1494-2288(-)